MVAEVFAGIGAFKTMFDIAKSIKDLDDSVKRNAAVADLWEQIIAAQTRYSEAIEEKRELEEKLAALETWNAQKARYQLQQVTTGVFAYTMKLGMENGEPPHMLCANCYQRGEPSILQATTKIEGGRRIHSCPNPKCKATFAMAATPIIGPIQV